MTCLNCGKEVTQTVGKRERKYCNDLCRATYAQKIKKAAKASIKNTGLPLPNDYVEIKQVAVFNTDKIVSQLLKIKPEPKEGSLAWYLKYPPKNDKPPGS